MAEKLNEELARLIAATSDKNEAVQDEAWNMIADFVIENQTQILATLRFAGK